MNNNVIIGLRIRTLRLKMRWTQMTLAKKLQVTTPVYNRMEAGLTDFKISKLYELAEIFEVSINSIVKQSRKESSRKEINNTSVSIPNITSLEKNLANALKERDAAFEKIINLQYLLIQKTNLHKEQQD